MFCLYKKEIFCSIWIKKNCEIIYYLYDDSNELIGINKSVSSNINIEFEKNTIDYINLLNQIDGTIYPEEELPENARKLKGFLWRGEEQIIKLEDIFPPEEREKEVPKENKKRKEWKQIF